MVHSPVRGINVNTAVKKNVAVLMPETIHVCTFHSSSIKSSNCSISKDCKYLKVSGEYSSKGVTFSENVFIDQLADF